MIVYIARDKSGILALYLDKPKRDKTNDCWSGLHYVVLNSQEYPALKWVDEPLRMKLLEQPEKKN